MNPRHYSDEILNALIDGELEAREQARIYQAMEKDEILRRRFNDLRQVSELIKEAYAGETAAAPRHRASKPPATLWPAAAMIGMLGLGALFAWHLYQHDAAPARTVAGAPAGGETLAQLAPVSEELRVLFHVGMEDPLLLDRVLTEADNLLSMQHDESHPLFVRVVASHGGLSLFRLNARETARRVRQLQQKFESHIAFVGCGETYGQWDAKTRDKDKLLPEMIMVDSGVAELLRRQKQGWSYVRI